MHSSQLAACHGQSGRSSLKSQLAAFVALWWIYIGRSVPVYVCGRRIVCIQRRQRKIFLEFEKTT